MWSKPYTARFQNLFRTICFGECSTFTKKNDIGGWSVLQTLLRFSLFMVLFCSFIILLIFSLFYSIVERSIQVCNYKYGFAHFSLQFYPFRLHVFWSSDAGCIHIEDCYIFLLNGPSYRVMYPFIPNNVPCSEVYFVWY